MLGIRHFLSQIGIEAHIRHYVDASAAKGGLLRKGAGKIKHLEVRQLWCQHAVEKYGIEVVKIPRKLNLADSLTHGIGKKDLALFHEAIGISVRSLESTSAMESEESRLAVAGSSACSGIHSGIQALGTMFWQSSEDGSSSRGGIGACLARDMRGQGGAILDLGVGEMRGCGGG